MSLLKIYHSLPAPVRSMAATLRGYYLRSWRYSTQTERLVEEAFERERWSPDRWRAWREERLVYVLDRAATRVPFYRRHWQERRRRGDAASWQNLENWPLLEKESLRADPSAFLADDCEPRRMFHEHTSGTSGKPLDLWWSRKTVHDWYALFEARWRRWYGVSRRDRWAILGGQLVTPAAERRPPFWVWNAAMRQLYLSSYHLAPDLIPQYLDAIERYDVRYMWGYSSALYSLAQEALRLGRTLPMRVAVANAEPLYGFQREAIAQAFACPVRETYGMSELVAAAGECEHGRLHMWPEAGWIEVKENGQPVPAGAAGELICTGLFNVDMPLIRYRVGDRGALPQPGAPCPCGRTLPLLKGLEGRVDDVLVTSDGRKVGRLDPVFKGEFKIREAQIVQESFGRIRVRCVPAPGFTPEASQALVSRLRAFLGPMEIVVEVMDEIPRGANGKFRAVVSLLARSRSGEESALTPLPCDSEF